MGAFKLFFVLLYTILAQQRIIYFQMKPHFCFSLKSYLKSYSTNRRQQANASNIIQYFQTGVRNLFAITVRMNCEISLECRRK